MRFDRVTTTEKFTKFLKKQIRDGIYKPGDKIPSERVLSEKYHISRLTINKILSSLVAEGVLFRDLNRGTYVSESQRTKLSVYLAHNPKMDMEKLTGLFEKTHPQVKVDYTYFSLREFEYNFGMETENGPKNKKFDVILTYGNTLDALLQHQLLKDISEYESAFFNDDIIRLPDSPYVRDNRRYAVPCLFSPVMIFCNKDIYRKSGVSIPGKNLSWKEFSILAKQLTVPGINQYGFAFRDHKNRWPVLITKKGGSILDDNGKCKLDSPETVKALKFFRDYVTSAKISPSPVSQVIKLFCEGKVAMLLDCCYTLPRFIDSANFPFDVIPVPGPGKYPSGLLATGFGINKETKHEKLAVDFIKTVISAEYQMKLEQDNCGIPIRKSVIPQKSIKWKFIKELPNSRISMRNSHQFEIFDQIQALTPLLWSEMISPEDFAQKLQSDITSSIHDSFEQHLKWEEVI